MNRIIVSFKGRIVSEPPFKGKAVTIGRGSGNDIEIDNPAVSSKHARIAREGKSFIIEDLGSTNGTFLNGEKIKKSILNSTDEITIGKHSLKLAWEEGTNGFGKEQEDSSAPIIDALDKTMMITGKVKKSGKGSVGILVVMDGKAEKERISLTDRVSTIGKSTDAQIKLKGLFTPKVAALINRKGDDYILDAADKKKPATVNGKPVTKPIKLKNGDTIEVGGITLRFIQK